MSEDIKKLMERNEESDKLVDLLYRFNNEELEEFRCEEIIDYLEDMKRDRMVLIESLRSIE